MGRTIGLSEFTEIRAAESGSLNLGLVFHKWTNFWMLKLPVDNLIKPEEIVQIQILLYTMLFLLFNRENPSLFNTTSHPTDRASLNFWVTFTRGWSGWKACFYQPKVWDQSYFSECSMPLGTLLDYYDTRVSYISTDEDELKIYPLLFLQEELDIRQCCCCLLFSH